MTDKFLKRLLQLTCLVFVLKLVTIFLQPLHHPSEARYAAIAMRMAVTGNYLMPFFDPITPFFGKPPLAFWASALSIEVFGFNEFAARLPHYLALLLTCLTLYVSSKKTFNKKTAVISVVTLSTSILFYGIHSVMTEAFLLLGMTLIFTSFIPTMRGETKYGPVFFLGCVIAMLTKGPVGIVMPCLAIPLYLTIAREWKSFFKNFPIICGSIFFLAATLPWFLLAEKSYPGFLEYFFIGENLGRFMKSGWEGDRYGNAHHVAFGTIWYYFVVTAIPALLALFIRPKQVTNVFVREIKLDKAFLFYSLSFAAPLLLLTFMSNMIPTYPVYAIAPFSVVMARILAKMEWKKFTKFLPYTAIILYLIIIIGFAARPTKLIQKLNYQEYLLSQIPEEEYQLYYLGDNRSIFTLHWETKDELKIITTEDFSKVSDSKNELPAYVISNEYIYDRLTAQERSELKLITCTKKRKVCLYESIS